MDSKEIEENNPILDEIKDQVLVVVPVYNEEDCLESTIKNLIEFFPNILIINDGSLDNTKNIISNLNINVITHYQNIGQGISIDSGLKYFIDRTQYRYLVTFDADGQHKAEDALRMVRILKKFNAAAVLGTRFFKGKKSQKNIPFMKYLTLKIAILYEYIVHRIPLSDAHNGLRVLRRDLIEKYLLPIDNFDNYHASEISYKIINSGLKYIETFVDINYEGKRSQNPLNSINIIFSSFFKLR